MKTNTKPTHGSDRHEAHHEVVVIGGGPAGSTTAAYLAQRGFDVALYERERFPRPHIGESLLPATLAVLDDVGVLPAIEAEGFLTKWGATWSWGKSAEPWSLYFRETSASYPHAYQVSRDRFDQILLEHAAASGTQVTQGIAVKAVHEGRVELDDGRRIGADIVVDASGQRSLIALARGLKRWVALFRNLAIYGYFRGARHLEPPDESNIFIESYANGWLWKIPLASGISSVGAVVDRDFGAAGIRKAGRERFYSDQVAATARASAMLEGADFVDGPHVVRDWSYRAETLAGDGFVLVGDAACFIDPLFSTGVHLAVTGGSLAAAYVATALRDPDLAVAAGDAYERLYLAQYRHFHDMARLFYGTNRARESYFWEARRLTGEARFTPRTAFVRAISGQAGFQVERAALGHTPLPESFRRELDRQVVTDAAPRVEPTHATRVRLASGLEVREQAVLGDSRFEMGHVIVGNGRDELPIGALAAELARTASGDSLEDIASRLTNPDAKSPEHVLSAAALLIAEDVLEVCS
ncbi:MAG: tryptophan 7-halogenase [Gammaproteobacteria bacterium]|nr:tryptophan 7-halogenase [Gammaproteobacteria bacterium]